MKVKISVLVFTLLVSITANCQNISLGSAINQAGRQRMLTQRMAKDYMMIGAGVKIDNASKEIDESISIFEEQYNTLIGYAPNKEVKDALKMVNTIWVKFRIDVATVPDVNNASQIIMDATMLMNACDNVVEKIQEYGNVKNTKLTNVSGKQRMISQRIGMLYTAYYWKVPYHDLTDIFDATVIDYEENLKFLIKESENYPEITETLTKIKSTWSFSKTGFDLKSNKLMPSVIYVTTNTMTNDFNKTTSQYEKLIGK
ncbi:hypothetical protein FNW52_17195 [Flavobacterium sp. ZT3R18]|uniref:type IV pili methyl-accepting chemotaxis transducer N-terminal domain-containing protein n=1 Tax=Flavobacterium sp. ZT3R18 TaxID=2594429 RepID=UPI00117B92CF|nr:type IV pili methyl-accepting chemotaxis transducer N-terminal domain-containing protein [Flavobacterium sp. ZT3R18]TRX32418.1 hypothetical protein FNW52_17195 [Flavobacterium sp. ZT3R18]